MFAIRELYAVFAITALLSSAILFCLHRSTPSTESVLYWAAAMSSLCIGQLLMILRGYIPFYLSIIVGNDITLFGLLLLWIGIRKFLNLDLSWRIYLFGMLNIATASFLFYWFSAIEFNVAVRIAAFSALAFPYTAFVACDLLTYRIKYKFALIFGIANVLTAIVWLLRSFTSLSAPLYKSFFTSGWWTAAHIVWMIVYIILATLTFIILTVEKRRQQRSRPDHPFF